jgi:hypothetical protein
MNKTKLMKFYFFGVRIFTCLLLLSFGAQLSGQNDNNIYDRSGKVFLETGTSIFFFGNNTGTSYVNLEASRP